jgi:flavodoxin
LRDSFAAPFPQESETGKGITEQTAGADMKPLIIYYTEPNDRVEALAEQIAGNIGADLMRLDPFGEDSFHGYHYTHVVFGSPVVKGTIAPVLREFIEKNRDEFFQMRFSAFMWREKRHWGDSFKELQKLIGPLKAEMMFTGKQDSRVDQFCEILQEE